MVESRLIEVDIEVNYRIYQLIFLRFNVAVRKKDSLLHYNCRHLCHKGGGGLCEEMLLDDGTFIVFAKALLRPVEISMYTNLHNNSPLSCLGNGYLDLHANNFHFEEMWLPLLLVKLKFALSKFQGYTLACFYGLSLL